MAKLCKPTAYQIRLFNQDEDALAELMLDRNSAALEVEEVLAANEVCGLTITLPGSLPASYIAWDNRIELRRSICGGEFEINGDQAYLIADHRRIWKDGAYAWIITAMSGMWLLKRHFVAHKDKTAQADKTGKSPDDMLRDVVREQMVAGTDFFGSKPERIVAGLTVDANTGSITPTIDKQMSTRTVLDVLKDIADTAAENGTWLGFDVPWTGSNFAFKTFLGYRGVNLADSLRISPEQGAIEDGELITSFVDAPTVVYAGGKGDGLARIISPPVVNTDMVRRSKYGWYEYFHDARNADTLQKVTDEAKAQARKMRPKRTLSLKLNDGVGATYGKDYRFGNIIGVLWDGELISARVDGVRISLKGGRESVVVTLNEVDSQYQAATTMPTATGRGVLVPSSQKSLAQIVKQLATQTVPLTTTPTRAAPTFANSWVNYGSPYYDASYAHDPAGALTLRGVIKDGTLNTPAFTLPATLTPAARLAYLTLSSGAVGRLNLHSDGTVVPEITSNVLYVLDGIHTWRNDLAWTDVATFTNSWVNFGAPFFNAAYTTDETGHTRFRGVIRLGTLNTPAFTLPTELRPAMRVAIATISNNGIGRVNIHADGTVVPEINSNLFYMLDRLYIPRADLPWVAPTMLNSWVYFGNTFFEPGYAVDEIGYVHLRGVIKSGTINNSAFVLPERMRPTKPVSLPTISNNALGVITINVDGSVIPAINSNAFYMLDGIKFLPT